MELEVSETEHTFILVDEASFSLAKRRRRGRNAIGKRATVDVPGQRGAVDGLQLHRAIIGPYNTVRLIAFLD